MQAESELPVRGYVKLFLGYASGVGKTYAMLAEAQRRKAEHGQDIVVGLVDTHGRADTEEMLAKLEMIRPRSIEYRGYFFDELDLERIVERKPQWVLVDDMAHVNAPGALHARRYQDIDYLQTKGINVLTTMNIQHLACLSDTIAEITGVHVRDTVPDYVVRDIAEVVAVDITPRALINRVKRGDVFQTSKAPLALANFYTEGNLSALREMALREVALAADNSVQRFRAERGIADPWKTTERVMVCIAPDHPSDRLLRRGWRIAHLLRASLVAVTVKPRSDRMSENKQLKENIRLAAELNIKFDEIIGDDTAKSLADYAHKNQITEIVIGHSHTSFIQKIGRGSIVNQLIDRVGGIDVLVIATSETRTKALH